MTPLPLEILHLPFEPGPFRMTMGLTAIPSDDIAEIDEKYPAEMAERRHLLATRHRDVFAATPTSGQAREETLEALAAILSRRHPTWFSRTAATLTNHLTNETWSLTVPEHDPLELAGRLVQEDLCLIDTGGEQPILVAAILCAPSRWRLADKIGRPLVAVHAPVPLYDDRLAAPVDRFMRHLKPGKLAMRRNWSIVDSGALFQLGGKHRTVVDPSITPENAPVRLFLRTERQTFMRLPVSGAVLFTIRVHSTPVARILEQPGTAKDLAAALRALPESLAVYKSLPAFRDALLTCLDRTAPS